MKEKSEISKGIKVDVSELKHPIKAEKNTREWGLRAQQAAINDLIHNC